jgi:hypothetical protein
MDTIGRSGKTVADRIASALLLQKIFGRSLMEDEKLKSLLSRLDQDIEATQRGMLSTGVMMECADCAVNGEGTCCGKHTGHKCDGVLLLINLLLGRSLPARPYYHDLCYFLTEEGCSLRARHIICVNYVCRRLRKNIPHNILIRLQEIAGPEMDTLFIVEEHIKKKLGPETLNQYRTIQ